MAISPEGPAVGAGRSSGACAHATQVRITRTCESPATGAARIISPSDYGERDRPGANLTQPDCNWEAIRGSVGAAARRARPEQRDLAPGERVAAARLDPCAEVAEHVVVHVTDRAAALAHEMVMRVLPGGLVEDAVPAQVGAQGEPGLDQHVERPVDGRRGHARD